jgi:hypothetical protein
MHRNRQVPAHKIFWIVRQYLYLCEVLTDNILLLQLYLGCMSNQRSILFCISPLAACSGALNCPSLFSEVSSISSRDAEGPADCGSGICTAEEFGGIGNEGNRRYHNE